MHKYSSNCKTQLKMVLGLSCTGACIDLDLNGINEPGLALSIIEVN